MGINEVLKKELELISVSKEDLNILQEKAKGIINKLKKVGANAYVGGSLAKGTLINKKIQDVDLFVIFDKEEDTAKLEEIVKKAGLVGKKVHGSRDYFQISENNLIFELIPVVKVKKLEKVKNVTDFSLFHVKYVLGKIKKNKKLADEIKLAKAFCYAHDCYGAESYIKGFSGYALELLVGYYGSFDKFLRGIQKDKIIDIEKKFKDKKQILNELNESKLQSPIVIIDPTYKYRNAAAGLSQETFDKFVDVAKKFLKKPGLKYFEKQKFSVDNMKKQAKKKKARFIEIKFKTDKQEGDIAATKMKKFFEFMISGLEDKQQKVVDKYFEYFGNKEAKGYLIVKENKELEIKGPSIKLKEAVENFERVRKKIFIKRGFAYAREKVNLEDIFAHIKMFEQEMSVEFEIV